MQGWENTGTQECRNVSIQVYRYVEEGEVPQKHMGKTGKSADGCCRFNITA
jgi:hypothetical protein